MGYISNPRRGITPTGTKQITQNGTYIVNVPNTYTASDEGKVVSNGALVAQTARAAEITQNGTYDTTLNDEVTVNVSGGVAKIPDLVLMDASVSVSGGNLLALIPFAGQFQLGNFGTSTQDGRQCWFRDGWGVTTNIIITKISAGLYRKLYIKARVWVYGPGWQHAKVFLARSVAMSGNQPSTAFKTVVLASQDYTSEQINAQAGVVINSTANNQLAYQTVEIDISDVNEDFYVGFWNCDLNMYITDIYLEA